MKPIERVRICVPVCERTSQAVRDASAKAAAIGDLVELRLDCLEDADLIAGLDQITEPLRRQGKAFVLTYRPEEQGGRRALNADRRYEFWSTDLSSPGSFFDLELDIVERLLARDAASLTHPDWTRIICSHHDFVGTPPDLDEIYDRMARTRARILKIAVQSEDITDCIRVFHLLDRARREQREIIAIAMGEAGIATRILGPSRGSFLTYGALENESATAPGQISAGELRSLYRIDTINKKTQVLGLAGWPVAHSISPQIQNLAFESKGLDSVYMPFAVRDIASFITRMVHPHTREIDWNMRGLSVTAPHKSAVINCLDWIEPAAREIGAVNTIVVEDEGLHGYNTDAGAFISTLIGRVGELRNARCAVIGAGGAASAALWGLKQERAEVTLYARDIDKARSLAERFGTMWESLGPAPFDGFDVVINATTLGTSGGQETETPAIAAQLGGARLAYDLVYNPVETRFLSEARDAGCDVLGGLEMLVEQAAAQFRLWTGMQAPEEVMRDAALGSLRPKS
ncbi:MAG: shikimate dehydrogenase [Pyrinomonadaceae bacterium]